MTRFRRCRRCRRCRVPAAPPLPLRLFWILAVPSAFLPGAHAALPPAGDAPPALHAGPGGADALLPSGRRITPRGTEIVVPPHPYGLALSRDGRTLVATSDGTGPFALTVVTPAAAPGSGAPAVRTLTSADAPAFKSAYLGVALSPDGRTLYASGGSDGRVHVFDLGGAGGRPVWTAAIGLDGAGYAESLSSRLALSPDGGTLLALDAANDRVAVIDTASRAVIASAPTGRIPFAVRWSPDGRAAYVANAGLFTYQPVEKVAGEDGRGLPFAPSGYPSKAARDGAVVDGRRVPGLGPVRTPAAYSVWGLDLSRRDAPKSLFRVNTGVPIAYGAAEDRDGEGDAPAEVRGAVGGSLPCAVAASGGFVYVSNANDDTVEVRDGRTGRLAGTVNLSDVLPPRLRGLRGLTPYGLAPSPDGRRLYVALSGFDAVAVVAAGTRRVLGLIPAGWYPADVAVSPDGRTLYVANAKGHGSGPNGGRAFRPGPEGSYVGALMKGTLQMAAVPPDAELPALTRAVLANNGVPADGAERPRTAALPPIQHVLLIVKENRTFDEVFGALPGVRGDASLARYGAPRPVAGIGTDRPVVAMPNHVALARRFALSDNFCVDSDVSSDGHRWLVAAPPNHWSDSVISAAYGGQMGGAPGSPAPGRRLLFGSDSSAMPEDYPEAGTLWHHLARSGVSFRNWGEGFEFAGIDEGPGLKPTGARLPLNVPMPLPLFRNTSREYPGFNTYIPDQYRADVFLQEFAERYESGREPLPRFLYVHLPNDHGAGPRPKDGYPAVASYMADNDLALGRIAERLSHSRFWRNTAIVVTEDDAQSGVDSVDAHRSVLMVISPWAKRGYVSRRSADFGAIHNAVFRLLGLPPLSLYDALASDLSDVWAATPDLAPYSAVLPDPLLFDPRKAKDPNDPDYRQARGRAFPPMDDPGAVRQLRGE